MSGGVSKWMVAAAGELGWRAESIEVARGYWKRLRGLTGYAPAPVSGGGAGAGGERDECCGGRRGDPRGRGGEAPGEPGTLPVMAFPGCRSVHTWGMRCPLDVAFADREGRVLARYDAVPPGRILFCPDAHGVLEMPAAGAHEGRGADAMGGDRQGAAPFGTRGKGRFDLVRLRSSWFHSPSRAPWRKK